MLDIKQAKDYPDFPTGFWYVDQNPQGCFSGFCGPWLWFADIWFLKVVCFYLSLKVKQDLLQKNHSNTNLVEIPSALIVILSFLYFMVFLTSWNGKLPQKSDWLHERIILIQSWSSSIHMFLRYCHLRVFAIFSNCFWRPSWMASFHILINFI